MQGHRHRRCGTADRVCEGAKVVPNVAHEIRYVVGTYKPSPHWRVEHAVVRALGSFWSGFYARVTTQRAQRHAFRDLLVQVVQVIVAGVQPAGEQLQTVRLLIQTHISHASGGRRHRRRRGRLCARHSRDGTGASKHPPQWQPQPQHRTASGPASSPSAPLLLVPQHNAAVLACCFQPRVFVACGALAEVVGGASWHERRFHVDSITGKIKRWGIFLFRSLYSLCTLSTCIGIALHPPRPVICVGDLTDTAK